MNFRTAPLHTPPRPGAAQRGDIKHSPAKRKTSTKQQPGISLPNIYHRPPKRRSPKFLVPLSGAKENVQNRQIPHENAVTIIRIGDAAPSSFVRAKNHVPQQPAHVRISIASRASQRRSRSCKASSRISYEPEEHPSLVMQYFGEGEDSLGIFTAEKMPLKHSRPLTSIQKPILLYSPQTGIEEAIEPVEQKNEGGGLNALLHFI